MSKNIQAPDHVFKLTEEASIESEALIATEQS